MGQKADKIGQRSFDELDDPDVAHRTLTEEGQKPEAYAANWMRPSPRRIQVARLAAA